MLPPLVHRRILMPTAMPPKLRTVRMICGRLHLLKTKNRWSWMARVRAKLLGGLLSVALSS